MIHTKYILWLKRIFTIQILFGVFLVFLINLYGQLFIDLLFTTDFNESLDYLKIFIYYSIVYSISNFFGFQVLVAHGKETLFSKIFIFNSLIHVFIFFTLTYFYELYGAVIAILITESLIAFFMTYYSLKLLKDEK